jgi:hypothetical protein
VKSSPVGTSAPPLAQVGTAHVDQPSPPVVTKVAPLPSEAAKVFVSPKPASAVVAASKPPSPAIRPQPESTAQARKPSTNSTPVAAVQAGKVTATSPVQSGVRQKTVPCANSDCPAYGKCTRCTGEAGNAEERVQIAPGALPQTAGEQAYHHSSKGIDSPCGCAIHACTRAKPTGDYPPKGAVSG